MEGGAFTRELRPEKDLTEEECLRRAEDLPPHPQSKKGLEAGQSMSPVPSLAFQLEKYVMTRVLQGCYSVFDNPETALVLLGATKGKKLMSLLPLNSFILR